MFRLFYERGRAMVNVEPWPGSLSREMVPWWRETTWET